MFKKGEVIRGEKRGRDESYHPVVFISGPDQAPLAIVLTHSVDNFPCNIKLLGNYGKKPSYFIAHLIEKLAEWGPYKKTGELTEEDLKLVEEHIFGLSSITWQQYEEYKINGCPNHG